MLFKAQWLSCSVSVEGGNSVPPSGDIQEEPAKLTSKTTALLLNLRLYLVAHTVENIMYKIIFTKTQITSLMASGLSSV